ncbi:ParB/RepB/Spo0J family partition protein [Streptomyces sp. NPDC047829]|uniref:ParB/RepB/Spo0J family partition protein n=1 Tax=Streptomyces sp. NPDC047829 TaxID=3154609 RepID=UPI0033C865D5
MSVADRLGTGSSFSGPRRSRSARGRAKAVTQGDVPVYELVRLRLSEVSPTPLNPRRNFGTDEDKTRFGEELRQAQLAACVAVTRPAYLALWPDHEDRIGDAAHVLVNGERRYHSAVHVGMDALDFVVRDDLAASREDFINHLLKENLEREDFDVIERARGVEQLVAVCAEAAGERGARTRAAKQLGKDRSWVTNQLVLLELPGELRAMLSAGSLAERDGRTLARYAKENPALEAAALLDHLKAAKEAAVRAKAEERVKLQALRAGEKDGLLSADNKPGGQELPTTRTLPDEHAEDSQVRSLLSADNKPGGEAEAPQSMTGALSADNKSSPESVRGPAKPPAQRKPAQDAGVSSGTPGSTGTPSQTTTQGNGSQPRKLPYDDPFYVVQHLRLKMTSADFLEGARVYLAVLREQHPKEYQALLLELSRQAQPSA